MSQDQLLAADALVTVLALLNRRAFPYAVVLFNQALCTFLAQLADRWLWMPWVDAGAFYALLAVYAYHPLKRGVACIALAAATLLVHAAYYWPQPSGVYYGMEYMYALQGLFLISMAVLALGDFDVRSFVGAVLEGVRRVAGRQPRPYMACQEAAEE